jgi:hypothetical protein
MKLAFATAAALAALWSAQGPAFPRFTALDVFVDAGGMPLAAYQVEVIASEGAAKVAGVEGGESAAFRAPPYYDPAALEGGRVIIAAFTLEASPPAGRMRVARLHFLEEGPVRYEVKAMAAAAPGGVRVEASAALERAEGAK